MQPFATDTMQFDGRDFEVCRYHDDDGTPPWQYCEGHGPVRFIEDREPLARGEMVLCDMPRGRYVYDWGRAIVQAAREGWGLGDKALQALTQRLGKKPTKAQIRAEAVRQDMAYLRGWCADDWHWMGVCVRIIGPDGEPQGDEFENAVWHVESFDDYWQECAGELAREILHYRAKAWRAALREARARKYWACRDVATVSTIG